MSRKSRRQNIKGERCANQSYYDHTRLFTFAFSFACCLRGAIEAEIVEMNINYEFSASSRSLCSHFLSCSYRCSSFYIQFDYPFYEVSALHWLGSRKSQSLLLHRCSRHVLLNNLWRHARTNDTRILLKTQKLYERVRTDTRAYY